MIDFGRAAGDYARHRQGFPPSFFARLAALGLRGRILDLGTGTGTIARGLGAIGLDVSHAMLREAAGFFRVASRAERTPFRDGAFDAITAGQCWTWFDGPRAARECRRLLRPGGAIVVAHFDYIPEGAAAETESIILRLNPAWTHAGVRHREQPARGHLEAAGFVDLSFSTWDETIEYSREAWRGRMRACNGVIALKEPAKIAAFDAELALRLRRYPDPLSIPHRIAILSGRVSS